MEWIRAFGIRRGCLGNEIRKKSIAVSGRKESLREQMRNLGITVRRMGKL